MKITLKDLAENICGYIFTDDMVWGLKQVLSLPENTYEISVEPTKFLVEAEEEDGR